MDSTSVDDNQAHAKGRRLALALLFSLAFHTLLLSLTFGDAEFGLPGLNVFWREQKMEAPSLRVELAVVPVAIEKPPEVPAVVLVAQRKVTRVVPERPVPSQPTVSPVLPAEPNPVVVIAAVEALPEIEMPEPPAAGVVEPKTAEPELPEGAVDMPKLDLPERETAPEQLKTAQLEAARQEAARQEAARVEAARQEEAVRREAERQAAEREALRQDAARREAARIEAEHQEAARAEANLREAERVAAERRAAELEAQRQRDAHREAENRMALAEAQRQEAVRLEAGRLEAARVEAERWEAARLEAERREAERQEALRLEAARLAREEEERREARLRAIGRQLDEEARQREAAASGSKLPLSLSTARRIRLLARTDPNVELVSYAEALARKIQLNTPADTVRELARRPHTDPLVTVAIRSDGSVESVTIVVSSGVAEIDAAIRSIVQSHAPYQAFPPGLARQADIVEIRRTWFFDVAVRLN